MISNAILLWCCLFGMRRDPEQEEDEDVSELSEAELKEKALEKVLILWLVWEWMMKNRLIVIHFY